MRFSILVLLCSAYTILEARTLESFFTPSQRYSLQIERDEESYEGEVAFQNGEQWWELYDEEQFILWFHDHKATFIDGSTRAMEDVSLNDLNAMSPFLSDVRQFFYQDVLPDTLNRKHMYKTNHGTLTISKDLDLKLCWQSADDQSIVTINFSFSSPQIQVPKQWFNRF
jgi:hypothetical protein